MPYLLVLWMSAYGFTSTITLQRFESREQCETIGKHIQAESGNLRSYECLPLDAKSASNR